MSDGVSPSPKGGKSRLGPPLNPPLTSKGKIQPYCAESAVDSNQPISISKVLPKGL